MDPNRLIDGLLGYLCLVLLVTFHEFGHAWMAWKRGDDTSRLLGRISLNPLVHMDLIGTVILPLLSVVLTASGSGLSQFIIGWGKPVPVNSANLKNRGLDWILIAMAGPAMNIILAFASVAFMKAGFTFDSEQIYQFAGRLAVMNLYLCFFNLLPIPPLDGSHVMRYFIGMSEETFLSIGRYGFIVVLFLIQFPPVQQLLLLVTASTFSVMAKILQVPVRFAGG